MDNSIRKNEICIIGQPSCDYVFSSTRSCFIAYGFEDSHLEMDILKGILEGKGIEAVEAGGSLTPAQSSFCGKICSKIITSQFCAVLLNNKVDGEYEIPNANVNMEYGQMLGFNKYVIPFQKDDQKLPFNVAGLDTIKYTDTDFKRLAEDAISQAIEETKQPIPKEQPRELYIDDTLHSFILLKEMTITDISTNPDERNVFNLGSPLGFNLLTDFTGLNYIYIGNFPGKRTDTILTRVRLLDKILSQRKGSLPEREKLGLIDSDQGPLVIKFFEEIKIWIITNSDNDKVLLKQELIKKPLHFQNTIYSLGEVREAVKKIF